MLRDLGEFDDHRSRHEYRRIELEGPPGEDRIHRVHLAEGSYIAVQIPESMEVVWNWDEWIYDRRTDRIVSSHDRNELVPFNYIILGVSRYRGD